MQEHTDHFGESVAASYDASSAEMFDPGVVEATVDLLADLSGNGRALEFGVGTGRIALALARAASASAASTSRRRCWTGCMPSPAPRRSG